MIDRNCIIRILVLFLGGIAAQAQFVPPHSELKCPTGCISMESYPTFLELRFGPTFNTQQDGFSLEIPFPMRVTMLDAWIGTYGGATFESDSRLQIILPDGAFYEFRAQFDKHQDVLGDMQRTFQVNLNLPAGTILYVYHSQFNIGSCPQGCGYDTTWGLFGTPVAPLPIHRR